MAIEVEFQLNQKELKLLKVRAIKRIGFWYIGVQHDVEPGLSWQAW